MKSELKRIITVGKSFEIMPVTKYRKVSEYWERYIDLKPYVDYVVNDKIGYNQWVADVKQYIELSHSAKITEFDKLFRSKGNHDFIIAKLIALDKFRWRILRQKIWKNIKELKDFFIAIIIKHNS